jgi:hypothetical protein
MQPLSIPRLFSLVNIFNVPIVIFLYSLEIVYLYVTACMCNGALCTYASMNVHIKIIFIFIPFMYHLLSVKLNLHNFARRYIFLKCCLLFKISTETRIVIKRFFLKGNRKKMAMNHVSLSSLTINI